MDILAALISAFLVTCTTTVNYEILRLIWEGFFNVRSRPRYFINLIVLLIFCGHVASIWIYGIAYWLMNKVESLGTLGGTHNHTFMDYIYFSATTYTSLGFGDIYPVGGFRMVAGAEVLNGLLLIGWSATITYFAMQRFWGFHSKKTPLSQEQNDLSIRSISHEHHAEREEDSKLVRER